MNRSNNPKGYTGQGSSFPFPGKPSYRITAKKVKTVKGKAISESVRQAQHKSRLARYKKKHSPA